MREIGGGIFIGLVLCVIGLSCCVTSLMAAGVPGEAPSGSSGPLGADEIHLEEKARLPDLVAYAYDRNPVIQAAREAWRATAEKYRISVSLPDPQVMVTYFPNPIETRLGPQDWNASISQKFPFPRPSFQRG